ncbi:MAG: hypothetical protein WC862_05055 [Patescibacteria group bacterium]
MNRTKMISVTIPADVLTKMKRTAQERQMTLSALLRAAFFSFVNKKEPCIYTDEELEDIFMLDKLKDKDRKELDRLLAN